MKSASLKFLLLGIVLLCAACAQPAREGQMRAGILTDVAVPESHFLRGQLAIGSVTGGEETNPMWVSKVGDKDFRGALDLSLKAYGFAGDPASSAYRIDAKLISMEQPLVGFDLTVTTSASYRLYRIADGPAKEPPVFERTVTLPFTADFSSSFMAVERLRLANEGAVRVNLEQLIRDLASLRAPAP